MAHVASPILLQQLMVVAWNSFSLGEGSRLSVRSGRCASKRRVAKSRGTLRSPRGAMGMQKSFSSPSPAPTSPRFARHESKRAWQILTRKQADRVCSLPSSRKSKATTSCCTQARTHKLWSLIAVGILNSTSVCQTHLQPSWSR